VWATAIYAGLRRGELQALRVCDIKLGKSLIFVERGWDQEEGVIDPKTYSSRRKVPLLAPLRDYLDEHLLRTGRSGEDLVFGRTATEAFYPSTMDNRAKRAWRAHNEKARETGAKELTPITCHEGRHTLVSMMIASGANAKAIQVAIGHTRIQTTYDTYGHMLPGAEDELRDQMESYLANAAEKAQQAA
jgi:integrase